MTDENIFQILASSEFAEDRIEAVNQISRKFSLLLNKKQAWRYLHDLTYDYYTDVRCNAAIAIGHIFHNIPNKNEAWDDLLRLTHDKDNDVRWRSALVLGDVFPQAPNIIQAWDQLILLTKNGIGDVRQCATLAIGFTFPNAPDIEQAWDDLIQLAQDNDNEVRQGAAFAISVAFPYVPDKNKTWEKLIQLATDNDRFVRRDAIRALGIVFPYVPNRGQAWHSLHKKMLDEDRFSLLGLAFAFGDVFHHVPNTKQVWSNLHKLLKNEDASVRWGAARTLGNVFSYIPDKEEAWADLHILTEDCIIVRAGAAYSLGQAYPYIPEKNRAIDDMHKLLHDKDSDVRIYANYSLGRAYIFDAIETEKEKDFKYYIEKALEFFENSTRDVTYFNNPAKFCLPFYRSFYAITFKRQADIEIQEDLTKAKNAIDGIESREKLFQAVENLANALKEAEETQKIDFETKKFNLHRYQQYCEHSLKLLDTTRDKMPWATKLIERVLPIIDKRIQEILPKIQETAETVCKESRGTSKEKIACDVNEEVKRWSIGNQEQMTRNVENIIFILEMRIPYNQNKNIHDYIRYMKEETDLAKIYEKVPLLISLIPTIVNIDIFEHIKNSTIINKSLVESSFNKVKKEHDEETGKALIQIAEFIHKSGNLPAGLLFDKFNEELNKSQPEKSNLKKIWEGIEKTLPSINDISDLKVYCNRLF